MRLWKYILGQCQRRCSSEHWASNAFRLLESRTVEQGRPVFLQGRSVSTTQWNSTIEAKDCHPQRPPRWSSSLFTQQLEPQNASRRSNVGTRRAQHTSPQQQGHRRAEMRAGKAGASTPPGEEAGEESEWQRVEEAANRMQEAATSSSSARSKDAHRKKTLLSADGSLPPEQPVRLVSEQGHRIVTYAEAAKDAGRAGTGLKVVSLTADPPVVKLESLVQSQQSPKTMREQKAALKDKRKRDLEQRRANTFKEVRMGFKNADNDLNRQLRGAEELLSQGYRVKLLYIFLLKDYAKAKEKFLRIKQDIDAWGYFEQSDGPGIKQRKMGGNQASFLILLLPKKART